MVKDQEGKAAESRRARGQIEDSSPPGEESRLLATDPQPGSCGAGRPSQWVWPKLPNSPLRPHLRPPAFFPTLGPTTEAWEEMLDPPQLSGSLGPFSGYQAMWPQQDKHLTYL